MPSHSSIRLTAAIVIILLGAMLAVVTLVTLGAASTQAELQTVQYEGHSFILWDGASYAGGIVHHPNCPCHDH